jgi:hypothetical protein
MSEPIYFLVNLETGIFTPTGFDMVDPPVDKPIKRVELDATPNEEQQAKILAILRSKQGGYRPPVEETETAEAKARRTVRAYADRYTAANGSMTGFAESVKIPASVVNAVMENTSVPLKALERAATAIKALVEPVL